MIFPNKKNTYNMDMETANQTLQNIFAACDTPPNTIPFDKIVLRQKARTRIFFFAKWICFLCVLLTMISPMAFQNMPSSFTNSVVGHNEIHVEKHFIKDSYFYLYVSGNDLELKYSYAVAKDGIVYLPISYNNEMGELVFPYTGDSLNIFVSYSKNEFLQIVLTPDKTNKKK